MDTVSQFEPLLEQVRSRRILPPANERRHIREQADVSLRALGGALGVSHAAVAAWERFGGREFLSRTDLRDLGLPRRAIDSCFGNAPVIVLPGYSRPLIRRADFEAFLLEHTYDETRVRP